MNENMYTIRNFRFTEQGWFADVIADGATLPHSIAFADVNAADCRNFEQARITAACLPFEPMFGCWVDVVQLEPVALGPQEPPNDYRIYNRRQADGTFPPLSGFFDEAVRRADAGQKEPATVTEQTEAVYGVLDLRRHDILYALDNEPVTKEQASALLSELGEIEAAKGSRLEFGSRAWFDSIEPIEF